MARLTDEQRELILADYHTGQYTNRELAKKYDTSHVTIGKMVKEIDPKYKEIVTTQVAINRDLEDASYQEVTSINNEVTKLTKYTNLVNRIQEKALDKADTMLDQIDTPMDLKLIVDSVDKASITLKVNARHAPKTDINNNNNQQNNEQKVIKVEYS